MKLKKWSKRYYTREEFANFYRNFSVSDEDGVRFIGLCLCELGEHGSTVSNAPLFALYER